MVLQLAEELYIEARLILHSDAKVAKALYKALEADNRDLPDDLELMMRTDEDLLLIEVKCRGIGRLRNTLEDLMRCIHGVLDLGATEK